VKILDCVAEQCSVAALLMHQTIATWNLVRIATAAACFAVPYLLDTCRVLVVVFVPSFAKSSISMEMGKLSDSVPLSCLCLCIDLFVFFGSHASSPAYLFFF
jgi:uncharacterized membrane protein YoaT (DUF817 family)